MSSFKFERYKDRRIDFCNIVEADDWYVKIYTITNKPTFQSKTILAAAIKELPGWLHNSFHLKLPTHNHAFLIIHEGRDGCWTLVNWWIDGEMLQTIIYYSRFENPVEFVEVLKKGSMACVWELAVTCHERRMWIEHILKNAAEPDFEGYRSGIIEIAGQFNLIGSSNRVSC